MTEVILTLEQLEAWKEELSSIDRQIAALNERKSLLQNILTLAGMVEQATDPDRPKRQGKIEGALGQSGQPMPLTDAILNVLRRFEEPMTPQQIRNRLRDIAYLKEHRGPYFYTAFKRLKKSNAITRMSDGRYMLGGRKLK